MVRLRSGWPGLSKVRLGAPSLGKAWPGTTWQAMAGHGWAGHGKAGPIVGAERLHPPDIRYSDWHRRLSPALGMIDLDAVECCSRCWSPVALIELAGWGTGPKPVTTLVELARRSGLPAFTVRHEFPEPVPIRLSVRDHATGQSVVLGPAEYEKFLIDLRNGHVCPRKR